MSFASYETSRYSGSPIELYHFQYGPDASHYFAYTSSAEDYTYGGVLYSAIPISRDSIKSSGSLDKSTLRLRVPRDIALAELFRVYPPSDVVSLVIRQGHLTDVPTPEFLVNWSGKVLSMEREGSEYVILGEPISSSMRRPGLRRHYQIGCPHLLYSVGVGMCNANKAAATYPATVASVSSTAVTLVAGWNGAISAVKFTEGMLEWTKPDGQTVIRKILSVSGDTLSLSGLVRDLVSGDVVNAILGCNHRKDSVDGGDCLPLHNNIQNYGGCDWIPIENPIGFNNQFY